MRLLRNICLRAVLSSPRTGRQKNLPEECVICGGSFEQTALAIGLSIDILVLERAVPDDPGVVVLSRAVVRGSIQLFGILAAWVHVGGLGFGLNRGTGEGCESGLVGARLVLNRLAKLL